jgi:co-chaperonin GroES (HSP10)
MTKAKVSFAPFGRNILVRALPDREKSKIIATVEKYGNTVMRAEVVAVGERVRDVKPNAKVLVNRLAGLDLDLGEPLVLLSETSVIARLE